MQLIRGPRLVWLAALAALVAGPTPALCASQFQQFFPGWSDLITQVLRDNCSQEINDYNANPYGQGRWEVIDCVLDSFSESRKAEVAAAALTLGLAPTILQSIGASTAETSILFLRRPFLTFLLSAASPSIRNPDGRYENPLIALMNPAEVAVLPIFRTRPAALGKTFVSLLKYLLAGLAAANVAVLAYQLGAWSFLASTNNIWDPALWTYTAVLIHLCGVIGILLFSKEVNNVSGQPKAETWFSRSVGREFVPTVYGEALQLEPRNGQPSLLSLTAKWILSIAPTLQVMFGTITLSGSLLMNQADARTCLFRYMLSAVVARGILSYELAGLRYASSAS